MNIIVRLALLIFSFLSVQVSAEDTAPSLAPVLPHDLQIPTAEDTSDHFFAELMNMLFMLGFVLLGLMIVAWILRRVLNARIEQLNATSLIKVIERRTLAPKVTLYIIEIAGSQLVIGETPSGLVRLGEISTQNPAFAQFMADDDPGKKGIS